MDPGADFLNYLLRALVFVSLILNLLCFKWRSIASYFFYIESFIRIVATSIPNQAGYDKDEVKLLYVYAALFLNLYTDSGKEIIFSCISYAYCLIFGLPVAYMRPLTIDSCAIYILIIFLYFVFCSVLGMILKLVIDTNQRLLVANESHVKLLNRMHEGLLILSSKD